MIKVNRIPSHGMPPSPSGSRPTARRLAAELIGDTPFNLLVGGDRVNKESSTP